MSINRYEGGEGSIQRVIALGTSNVTTGTHVVGVVPKDCRFIGVRFVGQAAVTATALTAEVFARTAAGATGVSIQADEADIEFGTEAAAKTGVTAAITGTSADQYADEGQLLEVVITADTCTAGPGDLVVEVEYLPR